MTPKKAQAPKVAQAPKKAPSQNFDPNQVVSGLLANQQAGAPTSVGNPLVFGGPQGPLPQQYAQPPGPPPPQPGPRPQVPGGAGLVPVPFGLPPQNPIPQGPGRLPVDNSTLNSALAELGKPSDIVTPDFLPRAQVPLGTVNVHAGNPRNDAEGNPLGNGVYNIEKDGSLGVMPPVHNTLKEIGAPIEDLKYSILRETDPSDERTAFLRNVGPDTTVQQFVEGLYGIIPAGPTLNGFISRVEGSGRRFGLAGVAPKRYDDRGPDAPSLLPDNLKYAILRDTNPGHGRAAFLDSIDESTTYQDILAAQAYLDSENRHSFGHLNSVIRPR